jgi:formyltetrahydrofolate-dependent phosphoribosylglycinamide formyltransferase
VEVEKQMNNLARLVVLISGNGSNLQALIEAGQAGLLPAEIVAVISNRAEAYGLERAKRSGIPGVVLEAKGRNRAEYDTELAHLVAGYRPDWVILAGWMRLLSMNFLGQFPNRVVNLHPALPGQFPGTHAIERAFEAGLDQTGVMVHVVPDEGVDNGPVLATQTVPILPDDTLDTLAARIHAVEHELLIDTIRRLITGQLPLPVKSTVS